MMKQAIYSLLLAVLVALPARAVPFADGGFEDAISPWVTTGNAGQLSGSPAYAQSGNNFELFDDTNAAGSSIAQTFDTVAGQEYEVDYWLASNAPFVPDNFTAQLGNDAPQAGSALGIGTATADYEENSLFAVASGPSTTLTFTLNNLAGGTYSVSLDSVSVMAAAPELSSDGATLGVFALLVAGLAFRTRPLR